MTLDVAVLLLSGEVTPKKSTPKSRALSVAVTRRLWVWGLVCREVSRC